jgi:hypothetical protein
MPNPFVAAVLRRALSQEGVREHRTNGHADNTGPQVEAYQRACGLPPGVAWCAAFVYWAVSEEAKAAGVPCPFPRDGYCPTIHSWARRKGLIVATPEPGDAFLVLRNYPDGRFASHIGIVTGVNGGRFATIEGNTGDGGTNEGDGVYQRSRPINANHVFIRWANLLPEPAEAPKPTTYALTINGKSVALMPVIKGRSYVAIRVWAAHWGLPLAWDGDAQVVTLNGQAVAHPLLMDGASYAPVADLAQAAGLTLAVDNAARTVAVSGSL